MARDEERQHIEALLAAPEESEQREGMRHLRDLGRHLGARRQASAILARFVANPDAHPAVRAEARALLRKWIPWRVRHARRQMVIGEFLVLVLVGVESAALMTVVGIGSEPTAGMRVAAALTIPLALALMGQGGRMMSWVMDAKPAAWRMRRRMEVLSAQVVIMVLTVAAATQDWAIPAIAAVVGTLGTAVILLWARLEPAANWWRHEIT